MLAFEPMRLQPGCSMPHAWNAFPATQPAPKAVGRMSGRPATEGGGSGAASSGGPRGVAARRSIVAEVATTIPVDIVLTFCKTTSVRGSSPPTLSAKERLILEMLVGGGSMYGLQLVEESRGALKRGTVYVTLARMEEKGYVQSEQEPPQPGAIGLPRRVYRPTPLGERLLRAWTVFARELTFGEAQ